MIPQEYIQEVVRRNDIEEVIGQYVQLRRRGRTLSGLCPFHNEKTPSFVVYPDTQSFYCFGCGAAGDVINFVRKYNNLGYVEAVKQLAGRAGMPLPEEDDRESRARQRLLEINRCAARYFYENLNAKTPEAAMARRYWKEKRGLSDAAIRRFGLGYAPEDFGGLLHYLKRRGFSEEELETSGLVKRSAKGNLYDIFRHRVMVPIIDVRGAIIAFGGRVLDDSKPKYINSPETMVYHKSRTLFALNIAKKSKNRRYILCEGYMDVISMHEAGFDTAVCACGTALTPEQVKLLTEYADEVVLSYDSDEAGQKATERSLALFSGTNLQVRVLNIPGAKDPDEFIKNMGADAFKERIAQAKNSFLFEIDVLKRNYQLEDPEQKTKFYQETAKKLLQFGEPLERDNYIQAVSREQMIKEEELRQLVNRLGMQMGLKAGDSYREDASGRNVISRENGSGPGNDMGRPEYGGNPYEGQAAQNQAAIKKTGRKQEREDGIRRSQRLLLTWLIENPALFDKIKGIITADDFVEDLYHQVAVMVFEGHEAGNVNPAGILSRFINDEDQYKEVAALFNASLKESLNNEEQKKAFAETVMKVRKNSLDTASRNAKDIAQLQEIIKQQAALKQLHISLD